ncbi:glutamate-gated chloride channel subunit beta [Eurytemora carolleeae]|uniref:glutamate-gated chloride channel subunit beta n=1 Tax=Eurytemora carolleeae TaxID=1294199 RepID=UPI000C75A379|nr:glutamate-gated chloride channel subunit beta [Eurytemora carolleeae]XP_023323456.1 glutamate-gated chloride channel subunit beta [Eurytemora carolleeae]|eukprot:XP_023323455.1 glutamate-gated chloride channel subunit beta-like [Eurytemora affinis]
MHFYLKCWEILSKLRIQVLCILCLLLLLLPPPTLHQDDEHTPPGMSKCVLGWCLPRGYQKLEQPNPEKAVMINVNLEILDILGVNDKEFSITLSMYFSVQWEESRIQTNNTVEADSWSPVSLEFLQDLWVPNIFIYDLKSFKSMDVLKRLAGVWIIDGKDVMYNQFCSVTFLCPMRFERYPLDEHICKFRVGSTNMDINLMRFEEALVQYNEKKRNTILDYLIEVLPLEQSDRILDYSGMNYSVTGFEMRLSRHVLKYLYIYYLPSGLFVVVSWVGFLIPPEVVPGRMAMLITLFLVLINIFNIVTSNSPNVEGMTAIAAWMLVCIFFVFGALVGYAYLLWKKKKSCLKRKRARKQTEEEGKLRTIRKEDYRSKVDDVFLVVFPIMFLVFNLIYWPMCLSGRQSGG